MEDIVAQDLSTREEAYLSIIPPFLAADKLPNEIIVDMTRDKARPYEQAGQWQEVTGPYYELLSIVLDGNPEID